MPHPDHDHIRSERADDDADGALVDETLALFQPVCREPLTRSDARAIARDIGDFLSILADWDRLDGEAAPAELAATDAGSPSKWSNP